VTRLVFRVLCFVDLGSGIALEWGTLSFAGILMGADEVEDHAFRAASHLYSLSIPSDCQSSDSRIALASATQ
jgi:hypothetical protein